MLPADSPWWRLPTWPELAVGAGLFVAFALLSVVLTGWVLLRLPADYFVGPHAPAFWRDRHPALRAVGRVLRNVLGIVLVIVGIVLSLPGVPGQGLLTILIGLICLDIPAKRRLEQRLVRRPRVLGFINRLRTRYGRAPLRTEDAVSPRGER
jgi:hypothetical protein